MTCFVENSKRKVRKRSFWWLVHYGHVFSFSLLTFLFLFLRKKRKRNEVTKVFEIEYILFDAKEEIINIERASYIISYRKLTLKMFKLNWLLSILYNIFDYSCQPLHNWEMIINELDDFQLVKYLLNNEYVLQKDLNTKLNEKLGKQTKESNFSWKLKRQHLTFKELKLICEILGYNLSVDKKCQ